MTPGKLKTECDQCGTCCRKGGPALHMEDKKLLLQNTINRNSLITIRKGEPVYSPDNFKPKWSTSEILKLKGKSGLWSCVFYNENEFSCSIYNQRPLECILLKCWDTADLEAVAGKNLLSRFDIISSNEPIVNHIKKHDEECDLELIYQLEISGRNSINKELLSDLNTLVNKDIEVRADAVKQLNLTLDLELFYFGRPLFKILSEFGLIAKELNGKVLMIQA